MSNWKEVSTQEKNKFYICSDGSHTPRSSEAFLEDASRSRMSVFSQKIKIYREMPKTAESGKTLLGAIIRKIRWDFLIRSLALSQNVRKNGHVSAQVGKDIPVQASTVQIIMQGYRV